ncbi:FmdB family zinc ribbon protein [Micrococcus terreus]|uniref:FmdB family zinc ribbon protein n=1 Tax=Micrococcus terreus TaxID=574650 RepID=UPI0030163560
MPTYAYACKDCGHQFDAVQSFSDDALTACPQCQGTLRKLFNSVGVVFKGSGFYRTDSRSGGADTSSAASGSGSSGSPKTSEGAASTAGSTSGASSSSSSSSTAGGSSSSSS